MRLTKATLLYKKEIHVFDNDDNDKHILKDLKVRY